MESFWRPLRTRGPVLAWAAAARREQVRKVKNTPLPGTRIV
jgi:hypothetical protein